jgi:cytochrome c oxidase subunit 1
MATTHAGDHHHGPAKGLTRWIFTTNHKDIGTLYLWFSFAMFILGGSFAMIIRAELFQPGLQLVRPEFFNQMTTMHGLVMVFGAIMPAFVGLANWMIPLMIGAPDMALPRMNNLRFSHSHSQCWHRRCLWKAVRRILAGHSTRRCRRPTRRRA